MSGTVLNPTSISQYDGSSNILDTLGKAGEALVAELHGKYYTQSYRGSLFYATQVSATAPAVYTATAVTSFGLWNPAGSGKNLVLAKIIYAPVTASSAAVMLGLAITQNAGSALGTAAPLSATTPITATRGSGLLNSVGNLTSVATAVSAATLTTAPTLFAPLLSYTTDVITTSSEGNAFVFDPEGMIIVQPGTFISLSSSAANTGTGIGGMWWYEAPL
jgi:hypothetical protein